MVQQSRAPTATAEGKAPGENPSGSEAPAAESSKEDAEKADISAIILRSTTSARAIMTACWTVGSGVEFKIKNNGNRTLNKVTVRIKFFDAQDKAIAEEEFNPVWVTSAAYDDDPPLRPNYIWQQESAEILRRKECPFRVEGWQGDRDHHGN